MKNRGLLDILLLALMVTLFFIGAHQTYIVGKAEGFKMGFFKSYWIFMIIILLMIFRQMRNNTGSGTHNQEENLENPSENKGNKKKNRT